MNNTDLIKIAGVENAKGMITTTEPLPGDLDYPEAKQFLTDYKAKYSSDPSSVCSLIASARISDTFISFVCLYHSVFCLILFEV